MYNDCGDCGDIQRGEEKKDPDPIIRQVYPTFGGGEVNVAFCFCILKKQRVDGGDRPKKKRQVQKVIA